MGLMENVLKSLLPRGHGWKLPEYHKGVIVGFSKYLDRAKLFLDAVIDESNPGTAEDTLEEWYEQLGIAYDSTQSVAKLRTRARQVYSSLGGQSLDYLNAQLQKAYPDVEINEVFVETTSMAGVLMAGRDMATDYPSWYAGAETGETPSFYYRVVGEVDTITDYNNVENLLSRIAPARLIPSFSITIREQTETAEAGLAMAGLAEAGKTKED